MCTVGPINYAPPVIVLSSLPLSWLVGSQTCPPCPRSPETPYDARNPRFFQAGMVSIDGNILLFLAVFAPSLNPFRTAVPFWGKILENLSGLSPKRDCGSKGVNKTSGLRARQWAPRCEDQRACPPGMLHAGGTGPGLRGDSAGSHRYPWRPRRVGLLPLCRGVLYRPPCPNDNT